MSFFLFILQIKVNETNRKESQVRAYGFIDILIYLCIKVLHLFFYIYIYKPKQKNNEKEENSSDGHAVAG